MGILILFLYLCFSKFLFLFSIFSINKLNQFFPFLLHIGHFSIVSIFISGRTLCLVILGKPNLVNGRI